MTRSLLKQIDVLGIKFDTETNPKKKHKILLKRAELIDKVLIRNWEYARMYKSRTGTH